MPGKQMAIDADLNAGVLTSDEAKERREEISREADFYGAMDGASKFVKGDAVAGILILAINIIGGLIIGVTQHDLDIGQASETYILCQLEMTCTNTIINARNRYRNHSYRCIFNREYGSSHRRTNFPIKGLDSVSAVLLLMGLVPGMPNTLFLFAAAIAGLSGLVMRRKEKTSELGVGEAGLTAEETTEKKPDQIDLIDVTDNSALSVQLGYGLIEMVDEDTGGPLVNRITSIRKQVKALGFVMPAVRVRDDMSLSANEYRIRVGQTIVGEDVIYPNCKMAIPGDSTNVKISGIEVKDPSFNMDAVWIERHKEAAESNGYVVIEPKSVLATHLSNNV